jgi:hypothetical protein
MSVFTDAINYTSGASRYLIDVTFPSGGTESNGVFLGNGATVVAFFAPTAWTSAFLSFSGSVNGVDWYPIYNSAQIEYYGSPLSQYATYVDIQTFVPWPWIKFRSGIDHGAVAQAAERKFTLIARAIA